MAVRRRFAHPAALVLALLAPAHAGTVAGRASDAPDGTLASAPARSPAPGAASSREPAAEPAPRAAYPLEAFVATLDTATLDDPAALQAALRAAESQLERAAPPRADCATALGAERYAGLHAAVGRARQALGERSGARVAWQAAVDCAPRVARHRLGLATTLLTLGELDAADAELARARRTSPGELDLEALQARIDFAAARWNESATRAAQLATRLQRAHEAALAAEAAAGSPRVLQVPADSGPGSETAAFWRILELLARRRAGQPADGMPAADPGLEGRWPEPLWWHLQGRLDEAGLVGRIRAAGSPRRRREMSCEALYYTAQQAFANGDQDLGRRRLALVVNLKVPYFVEHQLALAELARLRRAP